MFRFIALSVTFYLSGLLIEANLMDRGELHYIPFPEKTPSVAGPGLAKATSFGFVPVTIDILWMRLLQEAGMHQIQTGEHPPSYYFLKLLLNLDPNYFLAYYHGANHLAIVRKDTHGALEILEIANKYRSSFLPTMSGEFRDNFWKQEWRIPFTEAYVYWFELDDYKRGVEKFLDTAKFENAPPQVLSLKNKFNQEDGVFTVPLEFLKALKETASQDWQKEEYAKKERDLLVTRFMVQVNELFQAFMKSKKITASSFTNFLAAQRKNNIDPWGGRLFLNEHGKIATTTVREKTFGFEY